jgi:hypothetical protein
VDGLAIDKLRIVVAVDFDRQPADRFRRQIKRIMAVAHAGNADRWVYRVLFRAIHQVSPERLAILVAYLAAATGKDTEKN